MLHIACSALTCRQLARRHFPSFNQRNPQHRTWQGVTGFVGLLIMTIVPQVNEKFDLRMLWALFIVVTIMEPFAGAGFGERMCVCWGCGDPAVWRPRIGFGEEGGQGCAGEAKRGGRWHWPCMYAPSGTGHRPHSPTRPLARMTHLLPLRRWRDDQRLAACDGNADRCGHRPDLHVLHVPVQRPDIRTAPPKGTVACARRRGRPSMRGPGTRPGPGGARTAGKFGRPRRPASTPRPSSTHP